MPLSLQSPEDILNASLGRIGHATRIGDIYEGSPASAAALDIYAQTRDELLRQQDWGFAERNIAATLLKSAPVEGYAVAPWNPVTNPPLPWLFEYAYPVDCLKVRAVKPTPVFVPNFSPRPFTFSVANDTIAGTAQQVILSSVPSAILVYTGQITDMLTWESLFVEALIDTLGRRLAPVLSAMNAQQEQDEKLETAQESNEVRLADMQRG